MNKILIFTMLLFVIGCNQKEDTDVSHGLEIFNSTGTQSLWNADSPAPPAKYDSYTFIYDIYAPVAVVRTYPELVGYTIGTFDTIGAHSVFAEGIPRDVLSVVDYDLGYPRVTNAMSSAVYNGMEIRTDIVVNSCIPSLDTYDFILCDQAGNQVVNSASDSYAFYTKADYVDHRRFGLVDIIGVSLGLLWYTIDGTPVYNNAARFTFSLPEGVKPLPFVHSTKPFTITHSASGLPDVNGDVMWSMVIMLPYESASESYVPDVYIGVRTSELPVAATGYGIAVYDSLGNETFRSDHPPLYMEGLYPVSCSGNCEATSLSIPGVVKPAIFSPTPKLKTEWGVHDLFDITVYKFYYRGFQSSSESISFPYFEALNLPGGPDVQSHTYWNSRDFWVLDGSRYD